MLKQILIIERKTLIRGFFVSVLLIFPFTFLPVIFSKHNSFADFLHRIPQSLLYTILFAILVVIAAVYSNYQKLQAKEKLFAKAAFRSLGFQLQLEGMNSIVKEISPFLIGMHQTMLYKIDIDFDDNDANKFRIRMMPLLMSAVSNQKELAKNLKRNYKVEHFYDLCVLLSPKESDLDDPSFLSKHLTLINAEIQRLQSAPNLID